MPNPNTHVIGGSGLVDPDPHWAAWDAAWTRHLPTLTGRTDLRVVVAPGAGGSAPACFYPDHHRIEVDADLLGRPAIADPRRAAHRKVVPTAYGALVHEAAHAAHSRWRPPAGIVPILADVAAMLEESRAEHRQRTRRRVDRRWLRHMVKHLVAPTDAPVDDAWHAGRLAGLMLARVDARILTGTDVRGIRAAVTGVLGRERLARLREIWRQAHTLADDDATGMIDLAHRWCAVLGIDPTLQPVAPVADPGEFPGHLAAAITGYVAVASATTTAAYTDGYLATRHGAPTTWTRREPTEDEHRAARHLATRIHQARTQPEPATRAATVPPGRLRTRAAITADAQRAAGAMPTAAPWQQRTTLPPPRPTLRMAVLVDVSGSMDTYARALSSAGWIFAHAARAGDATTATIAFGSRATILTRPGQRPAEVLQMRTGGGTTAFCDAVKLADQMLALRLGGAVRICAVVSDGHLADPAAAQKLITTLHQAGCAVLWLHPDGLPARTFNHTTAITVADPVAAIGHITDAALHALAGT